MGTEHAPVEHPPAAPDPAAPRVEAGKGRRFGTVLVDYAGFFVSSFLLGTVVVLLFGERGAQVLEATPDLLLGGILVFAYYLFFEGISQLLAGEIAATRPLAVIMAESVAALRDWAKERTVPAD
jgi:hypothetical protein